MLKDYEQKIYDEMLDKMRYSYNKLKENYGEYSVGLDMRCAQPTFSIKIRVGNNDIYGDVRDNKVYLKCGSGPNILNKNFVDALRYLHDILICQIGLEASEEEI